MPHIYFHGNGNKELNSIVWQSRFSTMKQYFSKWPPPWAMRFHCDGQEPACHACENLHQERWPTVTTAETHRALPHCAHIHCLVSINVQQVSVSVSGCHCFCMKKHASTLLCFIHTSMSDTILSDCPSAAICHMTRKWKKMECKKTAGRFNLYCHSANISLWYRGPTS